MEKIGKYFMQLYHFSDKKFNKIKIDFFGINHHSKNDYQFPIKRFFCYDSINPQEYIFKNANYCYIIKIEDNKIYNLDNDVLKLKAKFNFNINSILEYIAKHFEACIYTHSFKCYIVFKDVKPIRIIERKKALLQGQG